MSNHNVQVKGEYFERINGGEWVKSENLVTNEGLAHILNTAFGSSPKPQGYHIALYSAAATPQEQWTAQNFASTAGEIVSMSEGYEGATRPKWTPENTATNSIDSLKTAAKFVIKTDSTLIQGASVKMDVAKTQLDAYRTDLQAYSESLNAERMKFELYKTRLDGENAKAEMGKTHAQIYATQMDAYKTQVQSEQVKLEAYDTLIKGELSKVQIYDTQVKAYAERLRAYQATGDLGLKEIQIKTDLAKSYIAKYGAELDGYKANLQANLSLVQTNAESFKAGVDAWRGKMQLELQGLETQSKWTDMQTRTNIAYSEMKMKEYESLVKNAQTKAQIALEAAKAVGQFSAQLAAGAMSAGHISASISASGSASNSESKSVSESTNHNYSY